MILDFLRSNAGLYTQYTAAFVFQFVGVALVIRDLFRSRANERLLRQNLGVISKVYSEVETHSGPHSLEVARGDESWATMIRPVLEVDMRGNLVWQALGQVVGYLDASKEPRKTLTWIGPVALGLGIVLGWVASMFAIR
ncbi:hypothetical protein [Rhodococcus sp. SJ-3]|uniref:hypothetical protein n=1 Tax=Rhodococcus sp. SJ-3 TaxID=3454628 RepID=UPI003F79853A